MEIIIPTESYGRIKQWLGDPYMAFRFVIYVGGSFLGAFSRFSGIKMEVQTLKARSGNDIRGVMSYVPVLTSYAPVTLSKGVLLYSDFFDWMSSTAAGRFAGPNGETLSRRIDIIALDQTGTLGVAWGLNGAMPVAYEVSEMDGSRSEVLTESVTFEYRSLERYTCNITAVNL